MDEQGWLGLADGTYQGEPNYLIVPPRPYRHLTPQQRAFEIAKVRGMVENFIGRPKFLIQVVTFFFKMCGVFLLIFCKQKCRVCLLCQTKRKIGRGDITLLIFFLL